MGKKKVKASILQQKKLNLKPPVTRQTDRAVRSFDLFDTLLGRLHYHPHSIFDLVEKDYPFPGFVFFRMAAAYASNHTLPDIYHQFQRLTGITDEQSVALMQFELETELSQVFPIEENLALVEDGDLIVSDTYYDEDQVKTIFKKIGLNQHIHLYATPFGKSSGTIWDLIKKKHIVSFHLGDSLHSDVEMPKSYAIMTSHYSNSQLSSAEQAMMNLEQGELACLMRALRLQNPYPHNSPEYLLWNEQSQLNVPLLIQASLYLNDFCQKHQKKRILFTSRDSCLWIQLFRELYPQYDSIYFHASRYTYLFPTPSYIDYVRNIHTDDTVIVDSHGKGRSCQVFFNQHLKIQPTYLAIVNSGKKHHAILRKKHFFEEIEKINYDVSGALYDVRDGKPLRCEPEYSLQFIQPMHACIEKCAKLIPHFTFQTFDKRVVKWATQSMASGLAVERFIHHASYHCHIIEGDLLQHIHLRQPDNSQLRDCEIIK
ncbi:MAG: hypothetical protein KGZ39_00640 [Simkania sp.]|nr:hypothetical protein [Simkania sp.]